jgi:hypothetical protein
MNPAPDAELASVGEFYHNWITNAVTNLVFKRLSERREAPRYRWDALLSPAPAQTFAVASQAEQASRTTEPNVANPGSPIKNEEAKAAAAETSSAKSSGRKTGKSARLKTE